MHGIVSLAAMDQQQNPGHEDLRQNGEGRRGREQHPHRLLGHHAGGFRSLGFQRAGIGRHEGRGKGAFGEHAAEQVRELLRRRPGVADGPGADTRDQQDVAHHAQHAARQREGRLHECVARDAHAGFLR